jgi:glycosyltransferase involved in cell wall biosynthesis
MPKPARLTIGMPVYNGETLVAATLDALLAQSYADFELIVCDNASTDRTPAIVEAYRARDPRIRYVRNERNIGANGNFTRVASLATAELFKWAAHDDLYAPTYLERCIEALDAEPDVVLAHADVVFIDETGAPFSRGDGARAWIEPATKACFTADPADLGESDSAIGRFRHVLFGSLWGTHMFGVVRRRALARTNLIQNVPSSDRPFLAELALLGRFRTVREPLFQKRFHSRMTTALSERELKAYVSGDGADYSKRGRQLSVYMATPAGKPLGWAEKAVCRCLVLAYGAKVALRTARGRHHAAIRPAPGASGVRGGNTKTAGQRP